jgi:thiamine pyrophosphokinase
MTDDLAVRAVILINGHLPDLAAARRHIRPGDRLICADAGAEHAIAMGLVPDVVVGDLDSLRPAQRVALAEAGVRFETFPVLKDKTDLELALQLAVAEGATEIDLLAALGGRLDQTLANLLLLARPEWAAVRVRVIEGNQIAWVMRGGQTTAVNGTIGDILSLVPLTPEVLGVTLDGVRWPLHDATLHLGETLTISNAMTAPLAHMRMEEGLMFVVHQTIGWMS